MILSVDEFKKYASTDLEDSVLEAKLQALELSIRKFTNNCFQARNKRIDCPIIAGKLIGYSPFFKVGDTIQISSSFYNDGIGVITDINGDEITLDVELYDEVEVTVTKIEYPMDVKMGVVDMMKYQFEFADKKGISSETISRHSVTYFDLNGDNSSIGYPKALIGFLKPYMKARF